jgi:hypothetical protein
MEKKLKKEIVIPPQLMKLFVKDPIRITDFGHTQGMFPPTPDYLKRLKDMMPEVFADKSIMGKFNVALIYTGNSMKSDFAKLGLDFTDKRIINKFILNGIIMKKIKIDGLNVVLTPKM